MDEVGTVLKDELHQVMGRLRELGGALTVEDGVALDDDELTEAGGAAGPSSEEREISFAVRSLLVERANRLAEALGRLRAGEYGTCQTCGGPIAAARLRAMPEVTTCLACQDAAEQAACRPGVVER